MMSWLTLGSDVLSNINSLHEGIPRHRDRSLARIRRVPSRNTYGMNEPHIGLTIMQFPTLLKALMLQPGIGLFSLVIRQNRRIDYRKGDHDLP